ncbi:ABC transporter ATP-binding protein [Blastococcus sp. CT_GayMR20]|uniref:ABC transporter ATP-binding protein n=1 Tax=Blastococcus sp. CT_GayMR20 TaxID=2559609 RepID=UPI001ADDD241|nr:ABC transporter ATP-binding protein [Blastococcus sp. CT_GayMR20]
MTGAAADQRRGSRPADALGIEVDSLRKEFVDDHGNRVAAVDNVSLAVPAGEFLVLLGPSGCGKTTLLRCLAGLEVPDSGEIRLSGRTVFGAGSRAEMTADRRVGMVFQSYALWPHMTVEENVGYPLSTGPRSARMSKAEARERVTELLQLMRLDAMAERKPNQLSGGQQQRVALARAIAAGNDVVLFDEPLSNIDAKVREALRLELRSMQRRLGFTAVYVTHDQTEALELADRIAVMRDGRVVQLGTPEEIYRAPLTRYVANFVGISNVLPATRTAERPDRLSAFDTALGTITVTAAGAEEAERVAVTSRAHSWWIRADGPTSGHNAWQGRVVSAAYLGMYTEFIVDVGGTLVRVWHDHGNGARNLEEGDLVWVGVSPEDCVVVVDDE